MREHVLPSGIKVKFGDGLVPSTIDVLELSHARMTIGTVTTGLEVSWSQPTRTISMEGATEAHATDIFQAVHGQVICGVELNCAMLPPGRERQWTVMVTNATGSIKYDEILALFPPELLSPQRPIFGNLARTPLNSDIKVIKSRIAVLTSRAVTGTQMLISTDKVRYRVLVEFEGAPNLEMLAASLNDRRLPELGKSPIYACERLQVALSVDRRCYEMNTHRLKQLAVRLLAEEKVAAAYDTEYFLGHPRRVSIDLGATSRQQLMRAKAAISAVLVSDQIPAPQQPPPPTRLPVSRKPTQTHRIRLTKTAAYRRVMNGGLREAKQAVGKDAVDFDETSDPPAVLVHGETSVLRKVQSVLFPDKKVRDDANSTRQENTATCEVCWDEVQCDDMVNLSACGHECCKDCFVNYCTVDANSKFPLRCFHVDCAEPLPLSLIIANLERTNLSELMQLAIDDHFHRHPEKYAQCPGINCAAYYEPNPIQAEYDCPICFTVSCIDCKVEQHFGERCRDYQYRITGQSRALELWIEESGAKRCTRCTTIIQKEVGCNNMQSPGCKANICFTCMEILPTYEDVYVHTHEQHGNYGDEEALELQEEIERRYYEAAEREHYEAALDRLRGRREGERGHLEAVRDLRLYQAAQDERERLEDIEIEARHQAPDGLHGLVEVPAARRGERRVWRMGPLGP